MKKRVVAGLLAGGLMAAMLPGLASAGGPAFSMEVIGPFTFEDEFLSDECGVDVETTVEGKRKLRAFEEDGTGVLQVNTVNISLVARAGDNAFRFRDVGADVVQQGPDGSLTLLIIGQLPFDFTGVLKIDLVTGEVIHEPSHFVDTSRVCRALTK